MFRRNFNLVLCMLTLCLPAVSANAAFIMNGVTKPAPGTYSWTANDMTGWAGLDAVTQSGSMASSGFMDGNTNASDSHAAALAVSSGSVTTVYNHMPNPIGVFDLGSTYHIAAIELIDGAGNGYWGSLGVEVRVSDTSANWATATSVGSFSYVISFGHDYISKDQTFTVNADARYILLQVKLQPVTRQYNAKMDEMNIFVVPEPASMAIMALGGLLLASPGRRKFASRHAH